MTNPDRSELVKIADELDGWHDCADGDVSAGDGHFRVVCVSDSEQQRLNLRATLREASTALRRLASSDSGVKGEPEPVAWRYRHVNYVDWSYAKTKHPRENLEQEPLFTAPPADAGMPDEVGWLIEMSDPPVYHRVTDDHDVYWTTDASKALRFARRDDAQAYSDHIGWTSPPVRIVEHMWPALTAPGATTKSDGGQPIHAVKMPEYHYQELDMSGDHHGVTSNYSEYTPVTVRGSTSDPSSTRSDPNEQAYADLIASGGIFPEVYQQGGASMTDDQIKHMVDRFLMWKLPEHFNPDCGISFDPSYRSEHGPVGTNLFDAVQATAMVRHMLEGLPITRSEVTVEELEVWLLENLRLDADPHQDARALLDQFEIRRKM